MTTIPEPLQLFLNEVNAGQFAHTPKIVRELAEKTDKTFALPKLELPLIENHIFYSDDCEIATRVYHRLLLEMKYFFGVYLLPVKQVMDI